MAASERALPIMYAIRPDCVILSKDASSAFVLMQVKAALAQRWDQQAEPFAGVFS